MTIASGVGGKGIFIIASAGNEEAIGFGDKTGQRNWRNPVLVVTLSIFVLAGFAIRLAQLGVQSFWYDEGFSVFLSVQDLGTITTRTAADIHPPLYYYLLHFWIQLVGNSEFGVRFLSLIWGVLTLPVLAKLARQTVLMIWASTQKAEYSAHTKRFVTLIEIVVVLLGMLNPALVYYSQEARMYSLVLFLTVLSSLCFLRILNTNAESRGKAWIWAFVLLCADVAAVYAHFYAFFIMGAQVFFLGFWVILGGRPRVFRACQVTAITIVSAIFYLPWAGFALNRLQSDVSYYQGVLEPSVLIAQTFDMFAAGLTFDENNLAVFGLLVVALVVVGLATIIFFGRMDGVDKKDRIQVVIYLALYLVIPFVLLYVVSFNRPKFHPRYLLIALPPVLTTIAILGPWFLANFQERGKSSAFRLAGLFLVFLPTLAFSGSLWSLSSEAKYVRDDWRGVAQFLTTQAEDNDAVILTSGHAFPVFTYYFHKQEWTPVPAEFTLSTENTVGYDIADTLNSALAGKTSLWVVRWQDNVVDPNGILKRMLDEQAKPVTTGKPFQGIRIDHYLLSPSVSFKAEPTVQRPVNINYENKMKLLGFDRIGGDFPSNDLAINASSGDEIALTLYWQALARLSEDYSVSLRIRDSENHFWGRVDRRPTDYYYFTQRWKAGEIIFGDYSLPILPGTPPGEYVIEAEIYSRSDSRNVGLSVLNEYGAPTGTSGILAKLHVGPAVSPVSLQSLTIPKPLAIQFDDLKLLGSDEVGVKEVRQGATFPVVLYWQSAQKMGKDLDLIIELIADDGSVVGTSRFSPAKKDYPTSQWQPGEVMRGQYDVRVPAGARTGGATIRIGVANGNIPVGDSVSLHRLTVLEQPRLTVAPRNAQNPLSVMFGDSVKLTGFDIEPQNRQVKVGETFKLTLYWEAQREMGKELVVFNHLLNNAGVVAAQHDGIPNEGQSPSTSWLPGDIIVDVHRIQIKAGTPPGGFLIETGLYEPATGLRLPTATGDDRVLLGELRAE